MGIPFLLILCSLVLLSCRQEDNRDYFIVRYRGSDYTQSDTNRVLRIEERSHKDSTLLSYYSQYDTVHYKLVLNSTSGSSVSGTFYDDACLRTDLDTIITLGSTSFLVTAFVANEDIQDGSTIHYYSPNVGVFASHSGTWPGLEYLQSSDSSFNRTVITLIKAVIDPFFLRGPLAK